MDSGNLPTAIIQLAGDGASKDLGTWVVSTWASDERLVEGVRQIYARSVGADVAQSIVSKLSVPQEVTVGGRTWRMALRPTRIYKEFSVTLLKTTHDVYPGTITSDNRQGIPKNFQSRVRIDNPSTGEKREVDIYMNNPLRYQGLTFYQQTMGRDERLELGQSGLQVVRNPSWQTPYWGCLVVAAGMIFQFGYHLVRFISKRRQTAVLA
jgi:ResB-like family